MDAKFDGIQAKCLLGPLIESRGSPELSSRRFENAVWRLMQKEKRTTWNDECLRKAVATIGKEIDFSSSTPAGGKKEVVEAEGW